MNILKQSWNPAGRIDIAGTIDCRGGLNKVIKSGPIKTGSESEQDKAVVCA